MTTYLFPDRSEWPEIVKRPTFDNSQLRDLVSGLLQQIREGGDRVLKELEARFDHCELNELQVSAAEFDEARQMIDAELAQAIDNAYRNIAC
ncbi:MAG: histidinol dehydrogenase, partial [Bacteroidales bacterium]|nr:histidinol dehydrogenase [Bacteroidales bacterium]